MKLISNYTSLSATTLPEFQNRQLPMHHLDVQSPVMPGGFEDYTDVVHSLCQQAGVLTREVHVTVDESVVQAGRSQRRPGAHVDGCYIPDLGRWRHYATDGSPIPRMAIIVAASVPGCIVYQGEFDGWPSEYGDLEEIRDQLGAGALLPANEAFLLSPHCVHESLPFTEPTTRAFLRLAFHLDN